MNGVLDNPLGGVSVRRVSTELITFVPRRKNDSIFGDTQLTGGMETADIGRRVNYVILTIAFARER